ncbi:hypothetical protein [Bacillus cereus]|uniref:hypothetical protein n=1 Tax=Bacillus cereus TaxID=1396 RepID=UPI001595D770|nr:hypothetical protein [Bacillus cereus]
MNIKIIKGCLKVNFKKSIVSLLSISALTFSFGGATLAQEIVPLTKNQSIKTTLLGNTDVAYWNTDVKANNTIILKSGFTIPSGIYAIAVDGYQEAGSRGNPRIVYTLHKVTGANSTEQVWSSTIKTENGYVYAAIPISVGDNTTTYVLKAQNLTDFTVALRGNIIASSH